MPIDFAGLVQPVSADAPCGPDLDLDGDPPFANLIAHCEAVLPTSFFTRDDEGNLQAFDRTSIDFPAEYKAVDTLLEETRDLRLVTIYARLLCLNRDLRLFSECFGGIAALLDERWDDVHPRADEGDYTLRGAVLQALDDSATIILPLQYMPLVESRRSGAISYRSILIATGEVAARADEPSLDRGTIDRAFADADSDRLKAVADQLQAVSVAAEQIRRVSLEKAGYEQAVVLEKLPPLLTKMLGVVNGALIARDPGAAAAAAGTAQAGPEAEATVTNGPKTKLGTVEEARRALAGVDGYFREFEPSSPAFLLVQQARGLIGKSFVDIVRSLVPERAPEARILLGSEKLFGLTLDQLESSRADDPSSDPSWTDTDGTTSEDGPTDEGDTGEGSGDAPDAPAADAPSYRPRTRAEALHLLDRVAEFFRTTQPSSPIPMLAERAQSMAERDFMSILKDILPGLVEPPS